MQNIFSRKEEPKKFITSRLAGESSLGGRKIIRDKFLDLHETMKRSGNDTYMCKYKRTVF